MTRTPSTHRRRPGFTLVELMVAAAVCVLIMAILATCFSTGIDTLRQLRSQGELTDQLRAAEVVIKRDLQAKRFLPEDDKENLGTRLSDLRYDLITVDDPANPTRLVASDRSPRWRPPKNGFVRIKSSDLSVLPGGAGSFYEGFDQDGLDATRATDHYLHLTCILPGGIDQNIYSATVFNAVPVSASNPTGMAAFTSPAAEIALFLDTGSGPIGFAGSVPLYNLIRRQRLVAMTDSDRFNFLPPNGNPPDAAVISVSAMTGAVNTLADLTNPNNRLCGPGIDPNTGKMQPGPAPNGGIVTCTPQPRGIDAYLAPVGGNRLGDDVLLSNVISFEVKVNYEPAKYGIPPLGVHPPSIPAPPWIAPRAYPNTPLPNNDNDNDNNPDRNTDYPFDYLAGRVPGVPSGTNNLTGGFNRGLNLMANGRYVFDTWTQYPSAVPGWVTFNAWDGIAMNAAPGASTSPVPTDDAIPMRARVKAIQIRVRIFDPKLKNARQLTIVQDM